MKTRRSIVWLAAVAALTLSACRDGSAQAPDAEPSTRDRPALGLFTTLPIYWGEADDLTAILDSQGEPEGARAALERSYTLEPLDSLATETLAPLDRLVLAQPRVLAPAENVALDDWVRAGGRALIFADPMLTQHSRYPLGDKRRPQDTVLLSPILTRWGLELRFDADQPGGMRLATINGESVRVQLAGEFTTTAAPGESVCAISDGGLMARCRIGAGSAVLIADAAMLDIAHDSGDAGAGPIDRLARDAMGD